MSHLMFLLLGAIWGTSFILMKKAALSLGPIGIGGWRVLIGAAALAILWHSGRSPDRRPWPVRRADLPALLLLAVTGYAVPFWLQPHLIHKYQDSAFIGMVICTVPLLTILVSVPMLGVYPRPRQVVGVAGGLGFMLVLSWNNLRLDLMSPPDVALAFVTPGLYAVANTYVKRRFPDTPAVALTCAAFALAGAVLLPISLGVETVNTAGGRLFESMIALLVLGVICTGLAQFLFYRLIQQHGPLHAGMIGYLIPCVALLWGYLDGERLTAVQVLCLLGIFAMVALVQSAPTRLPAALARQPDVVES